MAIENTSDVIPSPVIEGDSSGKKSFRLPDFSRIGSFFKKISPDKKIPLILASVLIFVVIILVILTKFSKIEKPKPLPLVPTEIPTREPTIASASAYASSSAILKIEKDLEDLDLELKKANFRESSLLPPNIDLDVKFEVTD
ncbi:MAG TPA: hypothetical protein VMW41_03900 [Candidatus Bathyarchaeia archaeon]|nr:hypothetical protein [Candidatus Bathyarchaeia archaeon]